mgnify:FL=1
MMAHITGKEMRAMSRATSSLQVTGISCIKASPYISKSQMMQMFNISQSTASRRISDLDRYVQNGRYGPYTILDGAGVTWVNYLALVDYLRYKKELDKGYRVPPFDPGKVAKAIGWGEMTSDMR